jgi:hypothetical protein
LVQLGWNKEKFPSQVEEKNGGGNDVSDFLISQERPVFGHILALFGHGSSS